MPKKQTEEPAKVRQLTPEEVFMALHKRCQQDPSCRDPEDTSGIDSVKAALRAKKAAKAQKRESRRRSKHTPVRHRLPEGGRVICGSGWRQSQRGSL
jgi:hypothetical protein